MLSKTRLFFHDVFEVSIWIKAVYGIFLIISGAILFFINTDTIRLIVQKVVSAELIENPNSFIANHILNASLSLSISTQHFIALYLIADGAIKVTIYVGLWRQKSWSYPVAGVLLTLLTLYSLFRIARHFSYFLLFFIIVDVVILVLLKSEYELWKDKNKTKKVSKKKR